MRLPWRRLSRMILAAGIAISAFSAKAQEAASTAVEPMPLEDLRRFVEILIRVASDYVNPSTPKDLLPSAINGALQGLDAHSRYIPPEEYEAMIRPPQSQYATGLELHSPNGTPEIVNVFPGSPAAAAGIKKGDLLIRIGETRTFGKPLDEIVDLLQDTSPSRVELELRTGGSNESRPVQVQRDKLDPSIWFWASPLEGDALYLKIKSFSSSTVMNINLELLKFQEHSGFIPKAIIIDIRDNTGGLMESIVSAARVFLREGTIGFVVERNGRKTFEAFDKTAPLGSVPIALLANERTATGAEFFAAALQDNRRAIVVGTRTVGYGSVQTIMPLHGGGAIKMTTGYLHTPSNRPLNGTGVTPDIPEEACLQPYQSLDEACIRRAMLALKIRKTQ